MIVVAEELIGIGGLQRHARRGRMRGGSVELSQHRARAEGIGELDPIQAIRRRAPVAKTKQHRVGGARLGPGRIGIQHVLIKNPHMGRSFDGPARRGLDFACQIDIADAVFRDLRRGVGRAPILLKQLDGRRCGRAEFIVGRAHIYMEFGLIVLGADVAIEAPNVRCREIAKSVIVQSFKRAVDGNIVDLLAPLRRALDTPKRAAHRIDLSAVIAEAVLHLHVDRPSQRVQAERRVVGHDRDRFDRGGWNKVPVDDVAERLVDAHAVLVHCEPLRRPRYGRCDESAELHVRLKRVARDLVDDNTRHIFHKGVADVQRSGLLDLLGTDNIDAGGHLVRVDAGAG